MKLTLTSEFRHRSRFFFHPSLRVASRNARHHLHHRRPRRHRHLYRDSSKRTVSNLSPVESIDQFHESLSPLSPYIHDFPANLRSTKSLRRICRVTSSGSTTLHEPWTRQLEREHGEAWKLEILSQLTEEKHGLDILRVEPALPP